ncbi:MFS transporter [Variovorax saccharolyticus]|uniref:MFS transporter n=1 Tax=Variovorax saccharolyticus TaxID=3053516 RepID=UPI0025787187|nr:MULTISPECIES: MFS transporter [unclassified Variovorax]MDM0021551.1 MFS transporter [Variovorax sp. J22R187]MDM0028192.1 MFS transporter [Variovorax sp. J31P216]
MNAPCSPCVEALADAGHPTSRATWLGVGSIAVGTFAMVTTEFLPIGLLTDIGAGLQVSDGTAGLMVTMPGVLAAFAGPALIVASGRLDRRTVMVTLTAMLVASNLLAAFAPNFGTMLVARLLLGLCIGGFWTFAPTAATQLVAPASRARAMSLVLAGVSAATVLGVPAGALVGTLAGWRAAFGLTGALAVIVLAIQVWLLPAMPPARAIRPRDLLTPLTRRMAQVGLLAVLFLVAGHFAAYTYLKPLLQQVFGLGSGAVTALLLAYGAVGFAGTFIGGSLVARSVRAATLLAAVLLASALLLSTLVGSGFIAGAVVVVAWGLAFGMIPVALTGWMMEAVPDAPEAGQALLVSGFQVAIATGALLGGLAVDGWGISTAMLLSGALVLVAAVIVGGLGRAPGRAALAASTEGG